MDGISFCPYRQSINTTHWSAVQTTELSDPVTFVSNVEVQQITDPVTFTGTTKDLELLEACKEGHDGSGVKKGKVPR